MKPWTTKEFWFDRLGEDWAKRLKTLLLSQYTDNLMTTLTNLYSTKEIYPDKKNVFRTFKDTPFASVRVVIVGQDPYSDGRATGIPFANENLPIFYMPSPSLDRIEDCVHRTIYDSLNFGFDYSLAHWTSQGVLLLNTAFTVAARTPGSHSELWKPFMKKLMAILNEETTGVIFCFWGAEAQEMANFIDQDKHYVLIAAHPAFAARTGRSWDCIHFQKINDILYGNTGEKIHW